MIDWTLFILDIIKSVIVGVAAGVPSFIVGMWFFNKYVAPKMVPDMIIKAIETPKVQELVKQGKELITNLEPFIEKVKGLNLEAIDGELINELLLNLKELVGTIGKKLEKPDIPEPAKPE